MKENVNITAYLLFFFVYQSENKRWVKGERDREDKWQLRKTNTKLRQDTLLFVFEGTEMEKSQEKKASFVV